MISEPSPAFAFLQLDARTFACVEGPLVPVAQPAPGRAAFLAPHFSLDREPWWWLPCGAEVHHVSAAEWQERHPRAGAPVVHPPWQPPDRTRFRAAFDSLQARLTDGRLRKGVPATRMRACLDEADAGVLFRRLLGRVPALPDGLIAYGLYLPHSGSRGSEFVIGATPELLFDIEETGGVRTWAIAGTRRAGPGADRALEDSAKDRLEHQAVVDDLLTQATRFGTPRAGPTGVGRFGNLLHLVTEIAVRPVATPEFDDLVRALHPTPALGVSPRGPEGDAWLHAIDPDGERRRFGAPFGIRWPSGRGRAAVAIRGLQYFDGHLEIWAGCGVVPSSRFDAEWNEALDKLEAVRALWET